MFSLEKSIILTLLIKIAGTYKHTVTGQGGGMNMRTESEILDAILSAAAEDDNIRAVIRTDLFPVRAYLHTYNFCFVVNDIEKYDDDDVFASRFGERILLYRGDQNYPELFPGTKAHLMVFRDGITIVINAMDRDAFLHRYHGDQEHENVWFGDTYQKLLDKDGLLPAIQRLEERQTLFSHIPAAAEFRGTCNEFWWVLKTFAEYTLRKELPSAMFYLQVPVRDLLHKMLRWLIVLEAGHAVDMGILDSRMEELLDPELFRLYRRTYPDADYAHIWEAYDAVVRLWHEAAVRITEKRGFPYDRDTEDNMLTFIRDLRQGRLE